MNFNKQALYMCIWSQCKLLSATVVHDREISQNGYLRRRSQYCDWGVNQGNFGNFTISWYIQVDLAYRKEVRSDPLGMTPPLILALVTLNGPEKLFYCQPGSPGCLKGNVMSVFISG